VRLSAMMCAGGVMTYLLLIPMITFFGSKVPGVLAPGTMPISEMGPDDIRNAYVLYIGAGAVATAGRKFAASAVFQYPASCVRPGRRAAGEWVARSAREGTVWSSVLSDVRIPGFGTILESVS